MSKQQKIPDNQQEFFAEELHQQDLKNLEPSKKMKYAEWEEYTLPVSIDLTIAIRKEKNDPDRIITHLTLNKLYYRHKISCVITKPHVLEKERWVEYG